MSHFHTSLIKEDLINSASKGHHHSQQPLKYKSPKTPVVVRTPTFLEGLHKVSQHIGVKLLWLHGIFLAPVGQNSHVHFLPALTEAETLELLSIVLLVGDGKCVFREFLGDVEHL